MDYSAMPAFDLFCLCVWREGRGEDTTNRQAIAFSIIERVKHPCWWGTDLRGVILKPRQYSSFNPGDPNETLFPDMSDPNTPDTLAYAQIRNICTLASAGTIPNPAPYATSYYDHSIAPPSWAATMTLVLQHGRMSFYARNEDLPPEAIPGALQNVVNE